MPLNPLRTARNVLSMPDQLQPQITDWTTNTLEELLIPDIFGVDRDKLPLSRARAMRVPAVSRARHLTVGALARLPLRAYRGEQQLDPPPTWCQGTDGQLGNLTPQRCAQLGIYAPQSPWARLAATIDDHLFYGYSLWLITRKDSDGFPSRMAHCPFDNWDIDPDGGAVIDLDGAPFNADDTILIPGPHDGILDFGRDTIRQAADLERIAADTARRPVRIELHQTTDVELTTTERHEIVQSVRRALADNDGILFTNSAIETKDHPMQAEQLLISGRNAAALDIARHVSMPGAMIDATTAKSSLEYQTTLTRNGQWIDYGLSLYSSALTARLGMDDVVPSGQRVALDFTDLIQINMTPTPTPTHD